MSRVLGAIGRVFITLGVLLLLFVAYLLWGTGLYTARAQDQLEQDFREELRGAPRPSTTTSSTNTTTTTATAPGAPAPSTTTTTERALPPPPEGEAVARIRIPKIGADDIVVNGVTRDDLRKGPGHYPDTPLPGQVGNAAIAGHRTTYGAPFADLDQLGEGDIITVRTIQGIFDFEVKEQLIVEPGDIAVLDSETDPDDPSRPLATLTLTTCNPKYSAAQRLVIKAELRVQDNALAAPKIKQRPRLQEEGLSGEDDSLLPTVISGIVVALIGALWWLAFHRHPRWPTWFLGAIPFVIALFVFYVFLERLLPSNY